jgi:glycosyltransferase involved in cell wall biosynthesis
MSLLSVIIPARNERYLQVTIDNLLAAAAGEIEIIPVMDGLSTFGMPAPDPRVRPIVHEIPLGMRPSINSAAAAARGKYLMKCDAHCIFPQGFDAVLTADCAEDELAVPTRHSIHPDTWTPKIRDFNYHYLTFPWDASMYGYGLHAKTYAPDRNRSVNAARAHVLVDDLMTFQGSCWLMHRAAFFRLLNPLDHVNYYFYQEAQEVGLKFWISGGRCVINKRTWYAHLHKGSSTGRGFYLSIKRKRASEAYAADYWTNDRWPAATRTWKWFIEKFWDSLIGWPADWEDPRHRKAFFEREVIPAHI